MTIRVMAKLAAWGFVSVVVLYAALNPDGGVVYQNPMAAIGLGLIGLGVCMETRRKAKAA